MITSLKEALAKYTILPQRWVMATMGFLALANAYTMRVCLNIAITQMVPSVGGAANSSIADHDSCPVHTDTGNITSSAVKVGGEYDWDQQTQGIILSSFFYGYVLTHIPGGMIAERFGGKHSLGLGILLTAIFTLLTPITVEKGGATGLIILRALEGLGEGVTYPSLNALLAQWTPPKERARMGSFVYGGPQIGNIAGTLVSGLLMKDSGDWPSVFYLFGSLGVLWYIFWILLCYNDPRSHPFISAEERQYLEESIDGRRDKDPQPVPWRAILTSVPMWALIVALIGNDYGYFTMVTDLPKYMTDVLKFDIKKTGILSAIPYMVMWFTSVLFGWMCDKIIELKWLTILQARKLFTTISNLGPGICIILASYAGCDSVLVITLLIAAMGFMGAFYPGVKVNSLDLSGNYAGTLMGLGNGVAAVTGIIAPYLVGILTPNHTLSEWRTAFWIALAVFVVTNVVFLIWADASEQWWNDIDKHGYPLKWKRWKDVVDIIAIDKNVQITKI